jgi:hypothetical protein
VLHVNGIETDDCDEKSDINFGQLVSEPILNIINYVQL